MAVSFNPTKFTFVDRECALCRHLLNPQDVTLFLAVSSCQPNPGQADWREIEGCDWLCIGHTAASSTIKKPGLPGLYLVHAFCNDIVKTAHKSRSLFDCLRALGTVLHEESSRPQRTWSWPSSCVIYGPIIRDILSNPVDCRIADTAPIRSKLKTRLERTQTVKKSLPTELVDSILDYLPFELAIALDRLSGGEKGCLRRLRQDPVARRFECASQILRHEKTELQHEKIELPPEEGEFQNLYSKVELKPDMVIEYVELGGRGYLKNFYAQRETNGQERTGKFMHYAITHNPDRKPYIAVQVDDIGITHIAFDHEGGEPKWISPNKINRQAAFFQDRGSAKGYDSVVVISDGMKLCAVDIQQQSGLFRTRAILTPGVSASHYSLAPYPMLYVRPSIVDITKSSGVYIWTPPSPGQPGFRLSNEPQAGFRALHFSSEGVPRTVAIISAPKSQVSFVRFHDEVAVRADTIVNIVHEVVGIWQFGFACNVVVAG